MIWSLIVGGIIGWIAGGIAGRDVPGGIIGNIIAGMLGSWLSSQFFADFGPVIGGYAVVPSLIGAVVIVLVFSWIARKMAK